MRHRYSDELLAIVIAIVLAAMILGLTFVLTK